MEINVNYSESIKYNKKGYTFSIVTALFIKLVISDKLAIPTFCILEGVRWWSLRATVRRDYYRQGQFHAKWRRDPLYQSFLRKFARSCSLKKLYGKCIYSLSDGEKRLFSKILEYRPDADIASLQMAVLLNRKDFVQSYLKKGAKSNDVGKGEFTPLQRAVRAGQIEIAKLLLDWGANPNLGFGEKPLQAACRLGHYSLIAPLLEKKADRNPSGTHPMQYLIDKLEMTTKRENHPVVLRALQSLLKEGAKPNMKCPGGTLFYRFATRCKMEHDMTSFLPNHYLLGGGNRDAWTETCKAFVAAGASQIKNFQDKAPYDLLPTEIRRTVETWRRAQLRKRLTAIRILTCTDSFV